MKLRTQTGLTFDDVLLIPKRSSIRSRSEVDTSTHLVPGIRLHIPIISSNMDTVTEAEMAIAMAQAGGIGIIHRFMSIEAQAQAVDKVKRSESFIVEDPLTIAPTTSLREAETIMEEAHIGGLVVVDGEGRLLGLLTSRDMLLAPDKGVSAERVMTPRAELVVASADEALHEARLTLHKHRVEKLPLVDGENRVQGLITAQDIIKLQKHPHATKDERGRLRVGVAVGIHRSDYVRAEACLGGGADLLVVDVAHGHAEHTIQMVRDLKERFPAVPVMAGNVATAAGVRDLAEAGADAVKVGVGSGSICITRVVTGFGVPQLTAVSECAEVGHELGVPIVADGGIRKSGDVSKAIGAGASTVMLGGMLAGTDESPGASVIRDGQQKKVIRGMASLTANVDRKAIDKSEQEIDWGEVVPEGVEAVVPYRGSVGDMLHQIVGGLRSGMSYAGAKTVPEFWENAEFIRITPAGKQESGVHDVDVL
ncbi:MAG: Inosine-5'-monophosphate dehydrogenase [Chloroflexi bacterium]|nr:Inosine-5'-monophosphate dehydrogenase [Chloroflexota bacterium]